MGLADLKKNASSCKTNNSVPLSVDDFIEAANLYANGVNLSRAGSQPYSHNIAKTDSTNITPINAHPKHRKCLHQGNKHSVKADELTTQQGTTNLQAVSSPFITCKHPKKQPFRRATFTLSEMAITQLTTLSQSSNTAKSKLIRQLINRHFAKSPTQRSEIETSIDID